MIIFIYGSDAYRLKQTREGLVNRYKNKYTSGMNFFSVDLSESTGIDTLENALKSASFFNEHRLVVCKNIFNKKTTAESLEKYIKEYNIAKATDITLIATENIAGKELATKNKELFTILADKKNIVQEIDLLRGEKLFEWIKKEFKSRGCSIESSAVRSLVNIVGGESWAIINEVDKLAVSGAGGITVSDITNLVTPKIDLNIFDLIDALGNNDRRRSIELLYKELKTGRDPYYILTMIIYQFRNILTIKDLQKRGLSESEISLKAKLNPFVVKKAMKSPFETAGATKIYAQLLAFDTGFKTSQTDLEDSLYGLTTLTY